MLNMSKINGPAATSFYYPQSTRAGSKVTAPSNNSLLGSSPGGLGLLSNTLKTAVSGKALFPEDNRTSPARTSAQGSSMVPPRGLSGNSKFATKIGNSSMTYSDLSGLHYRYQSPAQAASKINSSVTNTTLNIGKSSKYPPPLEVTQRMLQTPKSSGQRLMSGGFSNSGKSRIGREYREQKASSRVSSTKNQNSSNRQTTPYGKSRDYSIGKRTQPSTSIESLMSTSTDAEQLFPKESNKTDLESISDSLKQLEQ